MQGTGHSTLYTAFNTEQISLVYTVQSTWIMYTVYHILQTQCSWGCFTKVFYTELLSGWFAVFLLNLWNTQTFQRFKGYSIVNSHVAKGMRLFQESSESTWLHHLVLKLYTFSYILHGLYCTLHCTLSNSMKNTIYIVANQRQSDWPGMWCQI